MPERIKDPQNYRAISVPFETPEEANAALAEFQKDLREIRQKHRIADLLWVTSVFVKYPEGEGVALASGSYGDGMKAESMAAYAYGREQAAHREMVNKLIKGQL